MSEKQQRLVLSIIQFLNQSIKDGTIREEDKESLEVAVQCIGEAFGVDPADQEQVNRLSVKPATLQTIFEVYLKTKDKIDSNAVQTASGTSSATPASPSTEDKAAAERSKQEGNALMNSKQYDKAINAYTEAIGLDPSNPVYFSNRAAAHSSKGDHLSAVVDAERAIELDPKFVRGYSRLGHAHYCIGDYAGAATAYRRGLDLEPKNSAMKTGLQNSEARIASDGADNARSPAAAPSDSPSGDGGGGLGGLADTLRNIGSTGAGGMPDLASMMNNPAMMQMAQQMMANGGLERLMSNPAVTNMMNRLNDGDGLPSMQELMENPGLRDL
ncbi:putative stress-induced protein STI1 [Multifurca ochricompacta]|uniref:Stress-induced protein STI1 n=1 Tax=Multifurca ochricompacta TaxID=376703 RepID=A0AAD4MDH0_9AGAM|nr:putative stress-induced protein STI1 [Multifurca ochricompacta]